MSIVKKSSKKLPEKSLPNLPTEILTLISLFTGEFYIYRNRTIRCRCNICYDNVNRIIYYSSKPHLEMNIHKEILNIKKKLKKKLINV
jgi:hypothetical protein